MAGAFPLKWLMSAFKWRHFAGEVIFWAVRWYCRYSISYRELEEMLAERGVEVDHTTLYRWTQRYAPERPFEKSGRGEPLSVRVGEAVQHEPDHG